MLGATEEFVVSITAEQGVVASPAIKRICAGTGERPVASCKISPQKVCTIAPGKAVTAGPSFDRVVAGPAVYGVISVSREYNVVAAISLDQVIVGTGSPAGIHAGGSIVVVVNIIATWVTGIILIDLIGVVRAIDNTIPKVDA